MCPSSLERMKRVAHWPKIEQVGQCEADPGMTPDQLDPPTPKVALALAGTVAGGQPVRQLRLA